MSGETEGERIALERIAEEAEARTGELDLDWLGLSELPEALFVLKHLQRLNLGKPFGIVIGEWPGRRNTIGPNAAEGALARLKELPNLRALSLNSCRLESLRDLASLTSLQDLNCGGTQVSDLGPLAGLTSLQKLECSICKVSDLAPLEGLVNLQCLSCGFTNVGDLGPLAGLVNLQVLVCPETEVSELGPLAGLIDLKLLNVAKTGVCDLGPLAGLTTIRELHLSRCRLADFPRWLLERESLKQLYLWQTEIPGVPAAVLSPLPSDNCLDSLRAHVRDLEAGAVPVPDVKLLVLGNGRVGKTQLCRRLRGEEYDEGQASTHGIAATRAPLSAAAGAVPTILQFWDFGGQDLYHGTHALFTRANALFLLVWAPAFENTDEVTVDGITFRNQPLAYWVDYVRHLGGKRSAVVVVQTRCEQPQDEAPCPVAEAKLFAAFGFVRMLRYSAQTNRGRAALDEALAEAASWLREQEGIASIGAGRAWVKERLEALREADAQVPPAERQHRTVSQEDFQRLCAEAGGVSSPPHLLEYLHNAGIVFYRPGLFHDQVILDQGWALDAIYAVFHREKCYRLIRRFHGRFTRSDLAEWVWGEHSDEEQKLFLSMMLSCGICFEHRKAAQGLEAEYIAPELLPARAEVSLELQQKWDADAGTEEARFDYALLHPGLIRSIIARIGSAAGIAADYWQGGVYVYETGTGSRGMIEAESLGGWRGHVVVRTQRGRAADLLQRLCKLVEAENRSAGVTPQCVTGAAAGGRETRLREAAEEAAPASMTFAQERSPQPEWCVSYAWGDKTPEGLERERIVDEFCLAAEKSGKKIIRDKTEMRVGDSLVQFMQRIGRADRVFVILSDKYLKSPFCMFELSEVWRNCRQEEEEFLGHIRVYTLPCARIWSVEERQAYARHWETRHEVLKTLMQESTSTVGLADFQEFRLARNLYPNVSDILATVADVLQPRDFEDLVKYGFAD